MNESELLSNTYLITNFLKVEILHFVKTPKVGVLYELEPIVCHYER